MVKPLTFGHEELSTGRPPTSLPPPVRGSGTEIEIDVFTSKLSVAVVLVLHDMVAGE